MATNLQEIIPALFVGKGGAMMTPEEIARQREIAAALLQKGSDTSPVQHWTQGAARLADAFSGVMKERRATAATERNASENSSLIERMLAGLGGAPAIAPPVMASAPTPTPMPRPTNPNVGSTVDFARAEKAGDLKGGILNTAQALGIDPVDLATVISYETAGTFDPTKRGPTTQWGQHRGLIQFGEPQAAKYGVSWDDPLGTQLGPEGAIAKYLLDAGVQPGMGLLDVYSAVNAGRVGRYNASDANNGGAPGTVRDKVEKQMAGHRAKALALLGGEAAPVGATPVAPVPSEAPTAPVQVAQAAPVAASDVASSLNPVILQALSSPYADEQTKRIAGALLNQHLERQDQASDPMRAMELERARLELEAMRNPQAAPIEVGGVLLDGRTYQPIFDSRQQKEPDLPSEVRQYEYARGQGYQGSFADWQLDQRRAGATTVDARQMGTIPPGYTVEYDEAGRPVRMVPIPGGPAAAEADAAAAAAGNRQDVTAQRSGLVAEEIDRVLGLMDDGGLPVAGVGSWLSGVPGTDALAASKLLDTIKANIGFAELNKMREQSPTGGALGQVTERELQFLQSVAGSLDQAQSPEQLRYNLNRLWNTYQDVIHGPGQGPERRPLAAPVASNPATERFGDAAPKGDRLGSGKPIEEMTDEELKAIINGG